MAQCKKIAILGSTGSIGCQTLEIISEHPDLFKAEVLIAGSNSTLLVQQALEHRPSLIIIADRNKYAGLKEATASVGCAVECGEEAILEAVTRPEIDMVVTSTVGYSGLLPTMKAIEAGKDIALANKETLVVAGELVMEAAKKKGIGIYPVDSEHSAIAQCIRGENHSDIRKIIITASGGPFKDLPAHRLKDVSVKEALKHPNWKMGNKITIDSATMMNKAFEIIEATWLFNITAEKIVPVIHRQSIVHSMVEFEDGCIKAQLGVPDMRLPIKLALTKGKRLKAEDKSEYLGLAEMACLTFEKPDYERFPCLGLAELAMKRKGNTACVINAANEVAVKAFLEEKIRFTDIYRIIEGTLSKTPYIERPTLDDYINTNFEARSIATQLI